MNNNKRRHFRPRSQKSSFRRRPNGHHSQQTNFQTINGNKGFARNISSNPVALEKAIQKYQKMAKDAQSSGDLILFENYLQHADHYSRQLSNINTKDNQLEKPGVQQNTEKKDQNITGDK